MNDMLFLLTILILYVIIYLLRLLLVLHIITISDYVSLSLKCILYHDGYAYYIVCVRTYAWYGMVGYGMVCGMWFGRGNANLP